MSRFFSAVRSVIGVHEVLFLFGLAAFFYGVSGLWSIFGAFMLSGVILMGMSITAITVSLRKGP
jgi:hypothetical protein